MYQVHSVQNTVRVMNVERVESFRTSLMTQKTRLLKQTQVCGVTDWRDISINYLQLQNTFDKSKIESDLKKKEEDQKSTKSIILGALRKISGGSRKSSKVIFFSVVSFPMTRDFPLQEQSCQSPSPEVPPPAPLRVEAELSPPAPASVSTSQERNRTPVELSPVSGFPCQSPY